MQKKINIKKLALSTLFLTFAFSLGSCGSTAPCGLAKKETTKQNKTILVALDDNNDLKNQ